MFSSSRFFTETLLVSENRVLPPQTGWTLRDYNVPDALSSYINEQLNIMTESEEQDVKELNGFHIMQYAQQDLDSASTQSSSGWYYLMAAAFFVGLTIRFGGVLLVCVPLFRVCSNKSEDTNRYIEVLTITWHTFCLILYVFFLYCKLHCCNRSQQARSSVLIELKGSVPYRFEIAGLFLLFLVCLFISLVQIFWN